MNASSLVQMRLGGLMHTTMLGIIQNILEPGRSVLFPPPSRMRRPESEHTIRLNAAFFRSVLFSSAASYTLNEACPSPSTCMILARFPHLICEPRTPTRVLDSPIAVVRG